MLRARSIFSKQTQPNSHAWVHSQEPVVVNKTLRVRLPLESARVTALLNCPDSLHAIPFSSSSPKKVHAHSLGGLKVARNQACLDEPVNVSSNRSGLTFPSQKVPDRVMSRLPCTARGLGVRVAGAHTLQGSNAVHSPAFIVAAVTVIRLPCLCLAGRPVCNLAESSPLSYRVYQ